MNQVFLTSFRFILYAFLLSLWNDTWTIPVVIFIHSLFLCHQRTFSVTDGIILTEFVDLVLWSELSFHVTLRLQYSTNVIFLFRLHHGCEHYINGFPGG